MKQQKITMGNIFQRGNVKIGQRTAKGDQRNVKSDQRNVKGDPQADSDRFSVESNQFGRLQAFVDVAVDPHSGRLYDPTHPKVLSIMRDSGGSSNKKSPSLEREQRDSLNPTTEQQMALAKLEKGKITYLGLKECQPSSWHGKGSQTSLKENRLRSPSPSSLVLIEPRVEPEPPPPLAFIAIPGEKSRSKAKEPESARKPFQAVGPKKHFKSPKLTRPKSQGKHLKLAPTKLMQKTFPKPIKKHAKIEATKEPSKKSKQRRHNKATREPSPRSKRQRSPSKNRHERPHSTSLNEAKAKPSATSLFPTQFLQLQEPCVQPLMLESTLISPPSKNKKWPYIKKPYKPGSIIQARFTPAPIIFSQQQPLPNYDNRQQQPMLNFNQNQQHPMPNYRQSQQQLMPNFNQSQSQPMPNYNQSQLQPMPNFNPTQQQPMPNFNQNQQQPMQSYNQSQQPPMPNFNQSQPQPMPNFNQSQQQPMPHFNQKQQQQPIPNYNKYQPPPMPNNNKRQQPPLAH